MSESNRPCRKCDAPLLFAENAASGKLVPLDTRAQVFVVYRRRDGSKVAWSAKDVLDSGVTVRRDAGGGATEDLVAEGVYVTHFATCPHAGDFSKAAGEGSDG